MGRFRLILLSALAVLVATDPRVAKANGIDLPKLAGKPGERIDVVGHNWLTCCPRNTPVEHVELFLLTDTERLRLFDVPADEEGAIRAAFEVPSVPPESYSLEACSRGPELPGVAPGTTCLPEGNFTILAGQATGGGTFPLVPVLAIGIGAGFALAFAGALLYRRRRVSGSA